MAGFGNDSEFLSKPKSGAGAGAGVAAAAFNRSVTIHSNSTDFFKEPYLDRTFSVKKPMNSFDSVVTAGHSIKGKVKKLCNLFESRKASPASAKLNNSVIRLPGTEDRIVVYFTSLRGVRRTFEDCYAVRMIFRGFRVCVDERDISMDSAYRKELQLVLGEKNVSLPQIFIRGKHLGGAEVVKQLHETGELVKILAGFPMKEPGYVCQGCGDARFVPCANCSGSRKVFDEDEEVLKRCWECNENGLVRCPNCCF